MADQLDRLKAALANRYRIDRELGSGGMPNVHLAQNIRRKLDAAVRAVLLSLLLTHSGPLWSEPQQPSEPQAHKVADVPYPLAVSPDGQFLVEYGNRGSLTVRDLNTGETRSLTDKDYPELVGSATVSPGGEQIAYAWHNEHEFDDLRLIGVDGSDERILFQDSLVRSVRVKDWTEDGTLILVTILKRDSTAQVAYAPASGGEVHVILQLSPAEPLPETMVISHDGRFIVYDAPSELNGLEHDIYLMSGDGGRAVPLVENDADDRILAWSLDETEVLFASDRNGTVDIWSVPVSSGVPQDVPTVVQHDVGHIAPIGMAGDGSYYFGVEHSDCDVYVASLDAESGDLVGPPRKVSPAVRHTGVDWSPDGRRLAFVTPSRGVLPGNWAVTVAMRTLATGDERTFALPVESLHQLRPLWSPDGQRLIAKGWERNAYPRVGVYAITVETGEVTKLLSAPSPWQRAIDWIDWSADGRAVLFTDRVNDSTGIVMYDLTSRRETYLYRDTAPPYLGRLAPSPDGRSLAFGTFDIETNMDLLVVVSIPDGERRVLAELASPATFWPPAWAPDSRALIYQANDQLWKISARGGEPQSLGTLAPLRYGRGGLSIHPDGDRIAFVADGARRSEVWVIEHLGSRR